MIYTVENESSIALLISSVNFQLENNWKCRGGIAVSKNDDVEFFHQAMVRKKNKTPEFFEKQTTMDLLKSYKSEFTSKEYAKIEKDIEEIEPRFTVYIRAYLRQHALLSKSRIQEPMLRKYFEYLDWMSY